MRFLYEFRSRGFCLHVVLPIGLEREVGKVMIARPTATDGEIDAHFDMALSYL
jgi:hypothetical protein